MAAELPDVRPGQVWADNDPRAAGRRVRVVSVHQPDDHRSEPYARVTVEKVSRNVARKEAGEQRTILLRRFRGTRNGYKLHTDVSAATPPSAAPYPVEEATEVEARDEDGR